MKKLFSIAIIAAAISLLWSCKKSSSSTTNVDVSGKWTMTTLRSKTVTSMGTQDNTQNFLTGSYTDYRTDGKVYSYIGLTGLGYVRDTSTYSVNGNDVTIISLDLQDTTTLNVLSISSTSMQTYNKETTGLGTQEYWTNFTK